MRAPNPVASLAFKIRAPAGQFPRFLSRYGRRAGVDPAEELQVPSANRPLVKRSLRFREQPLRASSR